MAAYLVGTVRITDTIRFAEYSASIRGLSAEFSGESLVAGIVSDVLEGTSPVGERVVVTRFPTEADARSYLASERYIEARRLRAGAAEIELRLLVI